jgi:hypothetical protein
VGGDLRWSEQARISINTGIIPKAIETVWNTLKQV